MRLFTPVLYRLSIIAAIVVLLGSSQTAFAALSPAQIQAFQRGVNYANTEADESCIVQSSSGPVTAGTGAPSGASFPNLDPSKMAAGIDTWVAKENPDSALKGLGKTIVAGAKKSNVSPFLIVSIAKKESSLASPSDFNVSHANNSFGRSATSSQPNFQGAMLWYRWTSVKASVDYTAPENNAPNSGGDMAKYIRQRYPKQLDSNDLMALMQAYAPPGANDTATYIAQIKTWTSDLIKLSSGASPTNSPDTTGSPATQNGCAGGSGGSCAAAGGATTGDAAILCEAQKYDGIYYKFGGGHSAYTTFRQGCPVASVSGAAAASTAGSPGPCATDCSGLVTVAVNAAFGQKYAWTSSNSDGRMIGAGAESWRSITISQAQPGDIVTRSATGAHVEIVDHVDGSKIYTFGSHRTGTKTGLITTPLTYWSAAWHWTGSGSGN